MTSRWLGIVAAVLLSPAVAAGVPITFTTSLSGPNEFPPVASTGTGTATVILDTDAHTLFVDVTWSGLVSPTIVAHIHCCVSPAAANPTAGVATAVPTFPGFPAGVMAGTYTETFDLTDAASFNPAFVTDNGGTAAGAEAALAAGMNAGFAYLNIHSQMFQAGEIRGFLVEEVPEPGRVLSIAAIALGLFLARRRRGR